MDTYGWDTVSLLDIGRVNDVLAARSSDLRMRFETDLQSEPPVTASGEYERWSLERGGSGRLLYVGLHIKNGALNIGSGTRSPLADEAWRVTEEPRAFDLAGVTVVVAIDLRLISGPSQGQDLVFDIKQVHSAMPPPGEGYVTPVTILDPSGGLDVRAKALLGACIADDLVRNAHEVRFVFAHINPVPPASDSWLAPVASSYTYLEQAQVDKSYLGILSVTDDRPITDLAFEIDPTDVLGNFEQSFVISSELTLRKLLLPVLPNAYSTTPDAFWFDPENKMIANVRPFETFSVKSGAITYHPIIDKFEMWIDTTGVRTKIWGRCDMKAGIWMNFHVNTWNQASFDPQTKILAFLPDPSPTSSSNADIPWYFLFLSPVVSLITSICVAVISKDIADKLNNLLRSALSITRDPPKVVVWQGSDGFDVQSAGLNGALYMMGSVHK